MRLSRVLLAGAAVAAAGIATSAFTAGNDFDGVDTNIAGYGELTTSGVTVTNIKYNPAAADATLLHSVVFTVDKDTSDTTELMTLYSGTDVAATVTDCAYAPAVPSGHEVTCTLSPDLAFTAFDKTGLTVTSD